MERVRDVVDRYSEDFALFEDANSKLEYIFDLGKKHKSLPQELKNSDTLSTAVPLQRGLLQNVKMEN